MADENINELNDEIDNLLTEAYELLPDIIGKTKPSDDRAKLQGTRWENRHRLHVLLEVSSETSKKLSQNIIVAPWFLAELKATLNIIKKWKNKEIWKEIMPSLVNKSHFGHTIGKLMIAEHFMRGSKSHRVEIVPRGKDTSPDLRIQAIGGTQDWVYVECYHPSKLTGLNAKITEGDLDRVIKRAMDKAKRQFKKNNPGILAIFGYNQSGKNIQRLLDKISERLDNTSRPYLGGISIVVQSVLFKKTGEKVSFSPIISFRFISNPSYFGRVNIVSYIPTDNPRLIKETLMNVKTDDLINKKLNEISVNTGKKIDITYPIRKIKEKKLRIITEPKHMSRAIIKSEGKDIFPFFKGQGNYNFICGNCGSILAEHTWSISLSNIVIQCHSCNSYNEFSTIKDVQYPLIGSIALEKGVYSFSKWVTIKQGMILFGL